MTPISLYRSEHRDCPLLHAPDADLRIQLLHVPDCPLFDRVRDLVAQALAATGTTVSVEELCGPYPSPTLLIDGLDVLTGRPPDPGASCRLTLPSVGQIQAALRRSAR